jgi:hypothetical protein
VSQIITKKQIKRSTAVSFLFKLELLNPPNPGEAIYPGELNRYMPHTRMQARGYIRPKEATGRIAPGRQAISVSLPEVN